MNDEKPTREYGSRYNATASLVDLPVLAERILADLGEEIWALRREAAASLWARSNGAACRIESSLHVEEDDLLRLYIAGVPDSKIFASIGTDRYSDWANLLIYQLSEMLELYSWRNLQDLSDRRFKASIVLVSEDDHGNPAWTTGVVRKF
ncbi:hypothetical protein ABT256_14310 [Amycolatopsis japonica]|uniref:hypothetical protein n=1 Tax=Amycolatopsis japonica TaxID=208439 RepID=UPI003324020E